MTQLSASQDLLAPPPDDLPPRSFVPKKKAAVETNVLPLETRILALPSMGPTITETFQNPFVVGSTVECKEGKADTYGLPEQCRGRIIDIGKRNTKVEFSALSSNTDPNVAWVVTVPTGMLLLVSE